MESFLLRLTEAFVKSTVLSLLLSQNERIQQLQLLMLMYFFFIYSKITILPGLCFLFEYYSSKFKLKTCSKLNNNI